MRPAALAFDAAASTFDARFGEWQSVTAQRAAVREVLVEVFPPGARILEIGGGTGEDALWLAQRGFRLLLTDPSPAMVSIAARKLEPFRSRAEPLSAEDLEMASGGLPFDGIFSNFAALNCVDDLRTVGRGMARLLDPGNAALLVFFGNTAPAEILVECLRGRAGQAFRRFRHGAVPAKLGGLSFAVRYHRRHEICAAMHPWFRLVRHLGIGIFVPPSAAEPWISNHPRLLGLLDWLDCATRRRLAFLGDHILYHFERTGVAAP
jgi:ubiquinone/menaquinone biosynthesis C-methylase UbiE